MIRINNEYSDDMTNDFSISDIEERNPVVDISKIEIFLNHVREIIASGDDIIYNHLIFSKKISNLFEDIKISQTHSLLCV